MSRYRAFQYVGVAVAVLLPAVAVAELLDLALFEQGTPISSSAMNQNFDDINEKLDTLQTDLADARATIASRQLGRYCGDSSASTTGSMGGYEGATGLCASTGGACAATAHMCTTEELIRSAQNGIGPGRNVWHASGSWQQHTGTLFATDCQGYTFNGDNHEGAVWTEAHRPSSLVCSTAMPVACCE
jgi:hypothetical protein